VTQSRAFLFFGCLQLPCGKDEWVPYDLNISPIENLYDKPDNLDPQPEFPLRTELVFYKQETWEPPKLEILEGDLLGDEAMMSHNNNQAADDQPTFPTTILLLVLWVIGLCFWCFVFLRSTASPGLRRKKTVRKTDRSAKMVKDV